MPPKTSPATIAPNEKKAKKKVLKKSVIRFRKTCKRYRVSVRLAAIRRTSLPEDIETLTKDNRDEVIDPSNVLKKNYKDEANF